MTVTAADALAVYRSAECLFGEQEVDAIIASMAERLDRELSDTDAGEVVALCVMTGAVILAGKLLPKVESPLLLDYVHATRYRGATTGGDLAWLKRNELPVDGRTVVLIDDILDEGYTLEAIARHCEAQGARRVITVVLAEKRHGRGCGFQADIIGLEVPDRYVFGYGMDYKGYWRNAPGIYAVVES